MKMRLKISLLGDVALNGLFSSQPHINSLRFDGISKILRQSDLVLGNLETPLMGDNGFNKAKTESRGIIRYSNEAVFEEILPMLNITAVSLANNHIFDCRESGLGLTIGCLERLNIQFTGAGYKKEHVEPVFFYRNGQEIAFLAYVDANTNPNIPDNAKIFINYFDEHKIVDDIKQVKTRSDFVIVSLHWGIDYSYYPTVYQRMAAHEFIKAGANIVMGHHSHTIQPYEKYQGGIIFYSLGSFCYGDDLKKGRLGSLPRKTKHTIIPAVDTSLNLLNSVFIKELKGNRIMIKKISVKKWLRFRFFLMKIKHRNSIVSLLLDLKEGFFDRIIEYFFGYYQSPLRRLFTISNLKKIKVLFRDFMWKRGRHL